MSIETDVRAKKNEQAIGHIKNRLDTLEREDGDYEDAPTPDDGFSKELQEILELVAMKIGSLMVSREQTGQYLNDYEERIKKLETAKPRVIVKRAKRKKGAKKAA